jgi:hypothetical protein
MVRLVLRKLARLVLPHQVRATLRRIQARVRAERPPREVVFAPVVSAPVAPAPVEVEVPPAPEPPPVPRPVVTEGPVLVYVPVAAPPAPGAAPEPIIDPGATFVADRKGQITTETALHYLVCAMFEVPRLTGEPLRVFEFARANPDLWEDRERLNDAVRALLVGRLSAGENEDAVLACLQALRVHRAKTRASRAAYTTADKPVPEAVFWPNPVDPQRPSSLFDRLPLVARHPFITPETPVGSLGSCFAMEIAYRLQQDGYNYVVTEPDPHTNGLSKSCAAWGAIYNTPSFRQLVEKAFGRRALPKILWSHLSWKTRVYHDPFREALDFASPEEWEQGLAAHHRATRDALLRCKVFVFTLGMNEVWRLKADGSVFSRAPWNVMPEMVEQQVLTVEENVRELQQALDLWRTYNPELKLILSVSPVPLHATFRGADTHVITANCHSKSTLRVAAEEFAARNRDVFYFPSYETVMHCTRNPWWDDQRHVSAEAVDNVMRLFRQTFVAGEPAAGPDTKAA